MILIRNLTKEYEKTEILKNANYTFPQNGLVCLLGPSGCGKTTLLNLIAGFDTEYIGSISVGENTLSLLNSDELCDYRKDHVGFIFQDYHLLSGYTVLENILLPCDLCDSSKNQDIEHAVYILSKLGIESKKDEMIENLSGGQKQRVAIARALMKQPTILLADEPTGALDRQTSNEIMELLKLIAENVLVVVITHDKKVCSFAKEIIKIEDKNIIGFENKINKDINENKSISNKIVRSKPSKKIDIKKRAKKNFNVHMKKFITVAIAISLGISSFMLSVSSQNVMKSSFEKFKQKNTAFNNGYIKNQKYYNDKDIFNLLSRDSKISDVYYQYKVEHITISINGRTENLPELVPMPKASEGLSYGVMPRKDKNEIAITPSLARKLDNDISKLVGKTLTLKIGDYTRNLEVSGIYNAGYDSMFVSSDVENDIYKNVPHSKDIFSISYDVKEFEDVISINNMLINEKIESINAHKEISNLINTFESINKLFLIVSILIFIAGLFISIVLLLKVQNSRFREIGLLSALGFNKKQIKNIILTENLMLSVISASITLALIGICLGLSNILNISIKLNALQLVCSVVATFSIVGIVSIIISNKLVQVEPARALRM